jgi:succinate dehydrogenase / fumarate reductase cytochrome b subunit
MNFIARIWRSTVGKKFIMALTGCALILFVIGHLLGNLQVFLGPDVLNRYGHFLQSNMEIVWPARLGLLGCVVLHVLAAVRLSAENKAARPVGYKGAPNPIAASYASRTMMMSGLIVAAFIVYHLLHYTVLVQSMNFSGQDFAAFLDEKGRHDIYRMMIVGFQQPIVALFYVIAMALLCLHLSHGVEAMFQSLGVRVGCCPCLPKCLAKWGAILIFIGYACIPVAVLSGYDDAYAKHPPAAFTGKEAK